MATNRELLLLHRDMPQISQVKGYDLLLTPQFYIFKREPIPVKYAYQAIKLAPSILDELVDGDGYEFTAIRDGDEWVMIAYDMDEIDTFLQSIGLSRDNVGKIYFAQQSKEYFEKAVAVDDKSAIVTINDSVVMMPKEFVDSDVFATLTDQARPAKGITPKSATSSSVGQTQAIAVSVLLLLLSGGYIAEGLRYQKALSSLDEKIESVKSKYPALEHKSSLVLNSLYKSSKSIDSHQRKIRDILKDIGSLTSKDSKIDSLKIDAKGYESTISTNKKSMTRLLKYTKIKNLTVKSSNGNLILKGAI